ncbi:hypothetical protein A2U01_0000797 [Trifolium medium]|uniref:Uncharacterized protein n=1 Tax=Trifolium medium TaxID=97028 RepID=A0A392LYN9_9FABA|nr:hypothetical protein [Trifolium medium]
MLKNRNVVRRVLWLKDVWGEMVLYEGKEVILEVGFHTFTFRHHSFSAALTLTTLAGNLSLTLTIIASPPRRPSLSLSLSLTLTISRRPSFSAVGHLSLK